MINSIKRFCVLLFSSINISVNIDFYDKFHQTFLPSHVVEVWIYVWEDVHQLFHMLQTDCVAAFEYFGGCVWEELTAVSTCWSNRNHWSYRLLVRKAAFSSSSSSSLFDLMYLFMFTLFHFLNQASCYSLWGAGRGI